jgi:hypothetical protein
MNTYKIYKDDIHFQTSVVNVTSLGLTLCVRVNSIMKFIYTPCMCKCKIM